LRHRFFQIFRRSARDFVIGYARQCEQKRFGGIMSTLLLIILVLLLISALPAWPYSSGWGYYPSGGLGLIVVIVLILVLLRII
jgi:hypothetical protein